MLVLKWHTNNRYLQKIISEHQIHTTALKSEALRFTDARHLKGKYKDKNRWVREYV